MLKNKSKLIIFLIAFIMLVSTAVFATDSVDPISIVPGDNAKAVDNTVVTTNENGETTDQDVNTTSDEEIYEGDLYLFDTKVVMDKLVDGNVFICGNDVSITGKVNGSLYVMGNSVTVSQNAYIVQALYVCANNFQMDGSANDIYAACSKMNMSYNAFAIRDLRVSAQTFDFKGGVGRDAFVTANTFNFATDSGNSAIVYRNLDYTSKNELSLSNTFVQGEIKASKLNDSATISTTKEVIIEKATDLLSTLIFTIIVFLLIIWLAPKFSNRASSYIGVKPVATSFGIGLLSFLVTIFVSFGLLFSVIGIPVSFAILAIFILMLCISFAVTATCITMKFKDKFNYSKKYLTVLTLLGTAIVLWLLKLIPYVGWIISIIITLFGFGTIIYYLFTKNSECSKSNKKEKKVEKKETK